MKTPRGQALRSPRPRVTSDPIQYNLLLCSFVCMLYCLLLIGFYVTYICSVFVCVLVSEGYTVQLPVSVKNTPLENNYIGTLAFRAPNQGLESSFCC